MYLLGFDWTYLLLVLPAVIFAMWANSRVNSAYKKYQNQYNTRNLTGAQAARFVLDRNGLQNIPIEMIDGNLTDHYDPKANVIRLSADVYRSSSSAAVGVACHEAGHAIQHAVHYAPIRLRTAIVPITNLGSKLAMPLFLAGLLLGGLGSIFAALTYIGIGCFALSTIFQLVTLPTEYNASNRALQCIKENQLLTGQELEGAKEMLSAAALTYVAALAVSLTQLLRLIAIANRRRR